MLQLQFNCFSSLMFNDVKVAWTMVGDNDGCKKLSLLVFWIQIRTYFSQLKWKILFCEKKVPIETEAIECPVDLESDIAQCFR